MKKITQTKTIDGSTWYYLADSDEKHNNYPTSDIADALYNSVNKIEPINFYDLHLWDDCIWASLDKFSINHIICVSNKYWRISYISYKDKEVIAERLKINNSGNIVFTSEYRVFKYMDENYYWMSARSIYED